MKRLNPINSIILKGAINDCKSIDDKSDKELNDQGFYVLGNTKPLDVQMLLSTSKDIFWKSLLGYTCR